MGTSHGLQRVVVPPWWKLGEDCLTAAMFQDWAPFDNIWKNSASTQHGFGMMVDLDG